MIAFIAQRSGDLWDRVVFIGGAVTGLLVTDSAARQLSPDLRIRLVTAPCFVAIKIDALHDWGKGDYRGSRDIKDIITLVDGDWNLVLRSPPHRRI